MVSFNRCVKRACTTKTTLEIIRDRTSVIYANWPTVATSSMPKIAKNISKYPNVLCGNICEVFELVNDGEIILADHKIIHICKNMNIATDPNE